MILRFKECKRLGTFFNLVSDNESEHENEEEEWEAQQIRKGVTGAQVRTSFAEINQNLI